MNTTPTDPGSFGSAGVDSLVTVTPACPGSTTTRVLDTNLFAEAEVPLSIFTGANGTCGAVFSASIISRASGSGGTTPDLKDLILTKVNFGSVSASGTLTGGCDGKLSYSASLTGGSGTASCEWSIQDSNGNEVTGGHIGPSTAACSGTFTVPVAAQGGTTYKASVTVTDSGTGATGCSDTKTGLSATVYSQPAVTIAPDSASLACSGTPASLTSDKITYTATVTNGSGTFTYTWKIDGVAVTVCNDLTSCAIDPDDSTMCADHDIVLVVHDAGSVGCNDATSEKEYYTKRTTVTSTNN